MTDTDANGTETDGENTNAENCLQLPAINAVIVGNGAIGTALLETLLDNSRLQHAVILGRQCKPLPDDGRIRFCHLDALKPDSITSAAVEVRELCGRLHLLVNTVGMLHSETQQPEKRLSDVTTESLQHSFAINAGLLASLAQAFGPLLRHAEPAVLASLSARVGSIEDNQLGGWYSYRAAKAAHNMLLRTLSREWRLSHRNVSVVALHPGTVRSPLSSPFISSTYANPVLTPQESAGYLMRLISTLSPDDSGLFYDWRGHTIPW